MELITDGIDFLLHLDDKLKWLIGEYGTGTYVILFLIVFAETGLVVTPFLPGDSLLFAAGIFAGEGSLNLGVLYAVFLSAAFLGDNTNYWIGRYIGPKMFQQENSRFFKRAYLQKTHSFFERYGGKTIVIARFVPIVRTFAPFVAGIGAMNYPRFLLFSIAGNVLWVSVCCLAGYYFGNLEFVRSNFEVAVLAIVALSLAPALFEIVSHRRRSRRLAAALPDEE